MNKTAQVILSLAGTIKIYDYNEETIKSAVIKGNIRYKGQILKVGDYVEYKEIDDVNQIVKIDDRLNDFVRPAVCNINQAFIVISIASPAMNLNFLDRLLAIMDYNGIESIILFSKQDLLPTCDEKSIEETIHYYEQMNYRTFQISSMDDSISKLYPLFKNKASVLIGQSGVGKTTLTNVLTNDKRMTNEISIRLMRGKNTTRSVEMIPCHEGFIVDTPGFQNLTIDEMDGLSLSQNFRDLFGVSSNCQIHNCLHINEPSCYVKKAVEDKLILKSRYENYLKLYREIQAKKRY